MNGLGFAYFRWAVLTDACGSKEGDPGDGALCESCFLNFETEGWDDVMGAAG